MGKRRVIYDPSGKVIAVEICLTTELDSLESFWIGYCKRVGVITLLSYNFIFSKITEKSDEKVTSNC